VPQQQHFVVCVGWCLRTRIHDIVPVAEQTLFTNFRMRKNEKKNEKDEKNGKNEQK